MPEREWRKIYVIHQGHNYTMDVSHFTGTFTTSLHFRCWNWYPNTTTASKITSSTYHSCVWFSTASARIVLCSHTVVIRWDAYPLQRDISPTLSSYMHMNDESIFTLYNEYILYGRWQWKFSAVYIQFKIMLIALLQDKSIVYAS